MLFFFFSIIRKHKVFDIYEGKSLREKQFLKAKTDP